VEREPFRLPFVASGPRTSVVIDIAEVIFDITEVNITEVIINIAEVIAGQAERLDCRRGATRHGAGAGA
jgi:hypothetical protein